MPNDNAADMAPEAGEHCLFIPDSITEAISKDVNGDSSHGAAMLMEMLCELQAFEAPRVFRTTDNEGVGHKIVTAPYESGTDRNARFSIFVAHNAQHSIDRYLEDRVEHLTMQGFLFNLATRTVHASEPSEAELILRSDKRWRTLSGLFGPFIRIHDNEHVLTSVPERWNFFLSTGNELLDTHNSNQNTFRLLGKLQLIQECDALENTIDVSLLHKALG